MAQFRKKDLTVRISPGVSMLGVLRNLNYKPWFALAEYVDNSLQSMLLNVKALKRVDGKNYSLRVTIDIDTSDEGEIVITDNAAGILVEDFPRAFRAAEVPPDRTGLSEFGMGMKSASCWFAKDWTVRTKTAGNVHGFQIDFNLSEIVADQIEELDIEPYDDDLNSHYTQVVLRGLNHKPVGRSFTKIKQHLRDIYRVFLRDGRLDLVVNGESLSYSDPAVLSVPFYRSPESPPQLWRKEVEFDLGKKRRVSGFAALREIGATANPGFSLFRRGRVIEGSGEEGYRPFIIFGPGNSYRSQRLFGELHLEGFEVSHTKDGFQWGDDEEDFLLTLREALDADPLPLLRQAEGYRARTPPPDHQEIAARALNNAVQAIEDHLPSSLPDLEVLPAEDAPPALADSSTDGVQRTVEFEHSGDKWSISIQVVRGEPSGQWLTRSIGDPTDGINKVAVRLNGSHPFMIRFAERDAEALESIVRLAVAIVVSEVLARKAGVRSVGTVTRNIDMVLTSVLSGP